MISVVVGLLVLLAAILGSPGCSDRKHRNPLDPETLNPALSSAPLEAIAGDRQVTLRWDYSRFDDLSGVQLYRRIATGEFLLHGASPLGVAESAFVDSQLVNEITYEYQLALLVEGEGELFVGDGRPAASGAKVRRATPGEEFTWIGDPASGLVWRISPDGRDALFAQGRFPFIDALDVDHLDGSCWLSAGRGGLFRISPAGEVQTLSEPLVWPGTLALDSASGLGWVVDRETRDVFWFSLDEQDSGSLIVNGVDARFSDPAALAAADGGCWILDREEGRVLRYAPADKSRSEWADLEDPLALVAASDATAWLLDRRGNRLLRLTGDGETTDVALPFPTAVALDVDRTTGDCWVAGDADLTAFSGDGNMIFHEKLVERAVGIAVDETHGRVWIVSHVGLWKVTREGEILSRLTGFSSARHVAVHPRNRERI